MCRCLTRRRKQEDHLDGWLEDVLSGFGEDDYVLFDCPGQASANMNGQPVLR